MLGGTVISHFPLGGVWYMGIGSENRHLIPFLPYSYVWINIKKTKME